MFKFRSKSECKLQELESSLLTLQKVLHRLKQMKALTVFIKASLLFGWDKFHTQWLSSLLLKTQLRLSINTSLLTLKSHIQRASSLWLPSCLVTGLVSFVLLFLTQLTPWFQFLTKDQAMNLLELKWKQSTMILDSKDYGMDSWQESLWLEH
jgi:hypothetical protein